MKKIIIFLFLITCALNIKTKKVILPQETIRFRIIANSNTFEDQDLKWKINQEIIPILVDMSENVQTIDDMRQNINNNYDKIDHTVYKYTNNYHINYGMNYFPLKEYKKVVYPEGSYESLVITLGDGQGDNWWCILFPPLCLMEAKQNELNDVQYKSFVKEALNKYF